MEMNHIDNGYRETNLFSILKKLKNREALSQFIFSMGYYLPPISSFSHEYCFMWLSGSKKVRLFKNEAFDYSGIP